MISESTLGYIVGCLLLAWCLSMLHAYYFLKK